MQLMLELQIVAISVGGLEFRRQGFRVLGLELPQFYHRMVVDVIALEIVMLGFGIKAIRIGTESLQQRSLLCRF